MPLILDSIIVEKTLFIQWIVLGYCHEVPFVMAFYIRNNIQTQFHKFRHLTCLFFAQKTKNACRFHALNVIFSINPKCFRLFKTRAQNLCIYVRMDTCMYACIMNLYLCIMYVFMHLFIQTRYLGRLGPEHLIGMFINCQNIY